MSEATASGRGSRGRGGRVLLGLALLVALAAGLFVALREPAALHEDHLLAAQAPKAPAEAPSAPERAGGGAVTPAPAPSEPAHPAPLEPESGADLARRLFEEACRWIARGGEPVQRVRDVMLALDAKFDLDGVRHEGPMRLWLELPDLYRQEMTMSNSTTTRVMKGGNLHVRKGTGEFTHMNRSADGAAWLEQVRNDMERIEDLAVFLTLAPLRGPGVTFAWEGEKKPSGTYARPDGGTWAKIVRKAPGRPDISLWLAHEQDEQGRMRGLYPGVVRVDGDPAQDIPTEDFILQDWRDAPPDHPGASRFPRKIMAFQIRPGQPPLNFLSASVTDLEINAGIDPALFEAR